MNSSLATCGMDCRLCGAYQREKDPCSGCQNNSLNKPKHCLSCSYRLCPNLKDNNDKLCVYCSQFPCSRLKEFSKRYVEKYNLSLIETLKQSFYLGEVAFAKKIAKEWTCPQCGKLLCAHSANCKYCGAINYNYPRKKEEIPCVHLSETVSTNSYLSDWSKHEALYEGTCVWADFQTAGRGQKGNIWEAEKGVNLSFSLFFRPTFLLVKEQFILSQCVAWSIKEVLSTYTKDIKIKWPNDIYWQNRKLCGILIENKLEDNYLSQTIIGIGLNVNQEIFSCQAQTPPISLKEIIGEEIDRKILLEQIVAQIFKNYKTLKSGNRQQIIRNYKKDLFCTGYFRKDGVEFEAKIKEVLPDGTLVLLNKQKQEERYLFKEIEFVIF